jgi:glutaredoxin-related protein
VARDIHCVDCGTYLGEIRDAKLKKNISHICSSCTNMRKHHKTPDLQDTNFMSMFDEILKGKKY